jgi:hypothetical protein
MSKATEGMSKFPVSVPVGLHRAFKIKCASEGKLMSEAVRELLARECDIASKPKKPAQSPEKEIA